MKNHQLSQIPNFEIQFRSPYARVGFRLEDFAVYASLLSLPTAAQDSLCSMLGHTSAAGLSPARCAKLSWRTHFLGIEYPPTQIEDNTNVTSVLQKKEIVSPPDRYLREGGVNQFFILQTRDVLRTPHMVPHARTLRKAREQVKAMVDDDASLPQIKAYLNQWLRWWQRTSSTWNFEELSHAYIKSCWDPNAAKIAAFAFQQNYFTELCSCELIALVA